MLCMAESLINTRHPQSPVDLDALSFDDPAAYQILRQANTTAIFQLESDGMKKLLKKLQPDRFEDIIAVLALYRPGPLNSGMVDDFILRKKGQQSIDYFHPDLKPCLEPTYGVIVYQEQVMQISQIIGGYTLGGADLLRHHAEFLAQILSGLRHLARVCLCAAHDRRQVGDASTEFDRRLSTGAHLVGDLAEALLCQVGHDAAESDCRCLQAIDLLLSAR